MYVGGCACIVFALGNSYSNGVILRCAQRVIVWVPVDCRGGVAARQTFKGHIIALCHVPGQTSDPELQRIYKTGSGCLVTMSTLFNINVTEKKIQTLQLYNVTK